MEASRPRRRSLLMAPLHRLSSKNGYNYYKNSNGFEELRKYIKQGNEFCKDVAGIIQERSEAASAYSKCLAKLSMRLKKSNQSGIGTLADSWTLMSSEMETESDALRNFSTNLLNNIVKPLKTFAEVQHKARKPIESKIDKSTKQLNEYRIEEAKMRKQASGTARDREDQSNMLVTSQSPLTKGKITDKEISKQEKKLKGTESLLLKHDTEYIASSQRAEIARFEWLNCIYKNTEIIQSLEERRIGKMIEYLDIYNNLIANLAPSITKSCKNISSAIKSIDVKNDIIKIIDMKSTPSSAPEQYLLEFIAEDLSFRMDKVRRKDSLTSYSTQISKHIADVSKERGDSQKILSKAYQKNKSMKRNSLGDDDSMKIKMLDCNINRLEASKFKILEKLSEFENTKSPANKYSRYIERVTDKQGNTISILRMPSSEKLSPLDDRAPADGGFLAVEQYTESTKGRQSVISNYDDDEFDDETDNNSQAEQCKALYDYTPKESDELTLKKDDIIIIFKKEENDWWKGQVNGRIGIFPCNYVVLI